MGSDRGSGGRGARAAADLRPTRRYGPTQRSARIRVSHTGRGPGRTRSITPLSSLATICRRIRTSMISDHPIYSRLFASFQVIIMSPKNFPKKEIIKNILFSKKERKMEDEMIFTEECAANVGTELLQTPDNCNLKSSSEFLCAESRNSNAETTASMISNQSEMNTADWRWAADKGFWNPIRRCWNEELGGMQAYIAQRNQRRAARLARLSAGLNKTNAGSSIKPRTPKKKNLLGTSHIIHGKAHGAKLDESTFTGTEIVGISTPSVPNSWVCTTIGRSFQLSDPGSHSPSSLKNSVGIHWPQLICRRFWTYGYEPDPVLEIFRDLPTELRLYLDEVLNAIQQCADVVLKQNRNESFGVATQNEGIRPAVEQAAQWQYDTSHGFICVDLAPDTQDRVAVAFNARFAELLGLSPTELHARFAGHAVPLALPALDAVRGFLHSLCGVHTEASTCYSRLLLHPSGSSAALVCISTLKAFNARGQLCQVPWPGPLVWAASLTPSRSQPSSSSASGQFSRV